MGRRELSRFLLGHLSPHGADEDHGEFRHFVECARQFGSVDLLARKILSHDLFGNLVGLGQAIRERLPVPPGVALSGAIVGAVASGDEAALERITRDVRPLAGPLVESNGVIGWKLLQRLAGLLRDARAT